jgi:hypothetical protein
MSSQESFRNCQVLSSVVTKSVTILSSKAFSWTDKVAKRFTKQSPNESESPNKIKRRKSVCAMLLILTCHLMAGVSDPPRWCVKGPVKKSRMSIKENWVAQWVSWIEFRIGTDVVNGWKNCSDEGFIWATKDGRLQKWVLLNDRPPKWKSKRHSQCLFPTPSRIRLAPDNHRDHSRN